MFAASKTDGSGELPDPQFNYVTMLLHGDGTNGAQNNTFLDSSTNNFTITRNGNTTQGSFSPYGSNWSNYFDGSNAYLSSPADTALNMGTGNWTIECWVYISSRTLNYPLIFGNNNGSYSAGALALTNSNSDSASYNDKFFVAAYDVAVGSPTLVSSVTNSLNTWYHLAVVRNGTSLVMYRNGTSVASTTISAGVTFDWGKSGTRIGGGNWDGAQSYFNGYTSNLRVVKGTAVYTTAFTPSTTPLTAISGTSLLTCADNRFVDDSANNFTITANGTPSVQRINPFGASTAYSTSVIGGSGYFDGNGDYLVTSGTGGFNPRSTFTVEFWTYPLVSTNQVTFINSSTNTLFYIETNLDILFVGDGSVNTIGATAPQINRWTHVAVSFDGTTYRLFYNGVSQTASTTLLASNTISNFRIGLRSEGTRPFNGYITDTRVLVGTALYTSAFTPPTVPLTAITNTAVLLNYINGAIFDNAMQNNLETAGNAQISTSVKKYGTGSIDFGNISADTNFIRVSPSNGFYFTKDFTFEMWVYPYSLDTSHSGGNYAAIVDGDASAGSTFAWFVIHQESQSFYFATNGGAISMQTGNVITSANQWYHLAIVRLNGVLVMYVNGTQQATTSTSNAIGAVGRTIYLGKQPSTGRWFKGAIDDLRVTNGYARYTANFTPPTAAFPNTGPY